ncbi:MAG: AI-2E family transporter [Ktedonobacteraceae bacterium]|nr:AI-2E family transporter [Ktedonobacteraceae bacterium]
MRNDRRTRGLLNRVREGWEVVGHVVRRAPDASGSVIAATPADGFDIIEDNSTPDDLSRDATKWARRRDIPLAILGWTGVLFIVLWGAGHIARTITLLIVAALLAYALAPAVSMLQRWMPRFLAMLLVYLVVLSGISALGYFIISAAVSQITSLSTYVSDLLTPGKNGVTPLTGALKSFGISQSQITAIRDQLLSQTSGVVGGIVPFLAEFFNVVLDIILVAILSIYLLADGARVTTWLRQNTPRPQRGRVRFLLNTLQRIVGGYIRGQLLLCTLIGTLVGIGMTIIGVPYALLLGVLAFVLEFIPVLGTLVSGAVCVLLALTKGWVFAVIVLAYFVGVHILEGDVIGPRIVGKAVGLHPVVSLAALVAGAELFGIWGALFASPIAGVLQAFLIAIWSEWRETHPQDFQRAKEAVGDKLEQNVADKTVDPNQEEVQERLLS